MSEANWGEVPSAIAALGDGPLTEEGLGEHIWPLFSRVLGGVRPIYLANHSLGRPLDQTARDVQEGLDLWYDRLDGAWDEGAWPAEISRFRTSIARLIGHPDPSCVVAKTSAGQGLRAVLNSFDRPIRVVTTTGEFDSVDFILKVYQERGLLDVAWIPPYGPHASRVRAGGTSAIPAPFETPYILAAITPGTDLVVISAVMFMTGQVIADLPAIVARAHEVGAKVLVDAYHAAGVIPLDFDALGCDFMVGGSYKYARGGPGACWLAIQPKIIEQGLRTLDTGWFAKASPFSYARPDTPNFAEGGDAWLESTPSPLAMYQARAGLQLTLGIGVERIREYTLGLLEFLRNELEQAGVPVHQPQNPEDFGAFALVPYEDADAFCRRLAAAGVVTDTRLGFVRFGPDLLTSSAELRDAAQIAGRAWPSP